MKHFYSLLMLLSLVLLPAACTSDFDEPAPEAAAPHPVAVEMDITLSQFDKAPAARGANKTTERSTWQDGDVVWLKFTTAQGSYCDYISYTAATQFWTLHNLGSLQTGSSGVVEAHYWGNSTNAGSLTNMVPVYTDAKGSYTIADGKLSLTLNLAPATSRLRLKGAVGTSLSLSGLTTPSAYNSSTGALTKTTDPVALTVGSDGYTPYVYGNFANPSAPQLQLQMGNLTFTCNTFSSTALQTGTSGCLTVPTEDAHSGWSVDGNIRSFTANGVKFNMILVEHGTFQMGQSADGDNVTPVHSVTLSKDYYIGETEVTQALWYAVMGQKPTSSGSQWDSTRGLGDNYPAYYISWNDCQEFITKLNELTGQQFRMPTEAEWEFAAKGGKKSQGYTYSGSNTIGDVAWYTSNSSSSTHPVATKQPNELGIYDMTGNVREWCSDRYGYYSSTAVTDPTGATSGSYRVIRGGSWGNIAADCRTAYRGSNNPALRSADLGFRLCLSPSK